MKIKEKDTYVYVVEDLHSGIISVLKWFKEFINIFMQVNILYPLFYFSLVYLKHYSNKKNTIFRGNLVWMLNM